jgi:5'-deoxynucleotidase YfbR-like HD superfamily hydrolase
MLEWIKEMRAAGEVKRFHACRMLRSQTVAAHTWGVIVNLIAAGYADEAALIEHAMFHDAAELETGDIPAPAKWNSAALNSAVQAMERAFNDKHGIDDAHPQFKHLVSWADTFELCLWCMEEARMGNTYALEPLGNGLRHLMVHFNTGDTIRNLNAALYKEAQQYVGQ